MGNDKILRVPEFRAPKEFEIKHTHASVVLGGYHLPAKVQNVVELGCGNGVALLAMAILNPSVEKLIGVDVDPKACEVAKKFIKLNNLEDKMEILNVDILKLSKEIGYEAADFVIFNPPFHLSGKTSEDERRFLERNRNVFNDFVAMTTRILKNRKYFRFITSPSNLIVNLPILLKFHLTPKALIPIYGKMGTDSKLVLVEGIKNGNYAGFKVKKPIFFDSI